RLVMDPGRHVVVAPVAQHADHLRGQRLVEQAHGRVDVPAVGRGDRALLDVLARASLDFFHVGDERLRFRIVHRPLPWQSVAALTYAPPHAPERVLASSVGAAMRLALLCWMVSSAAFAAEVKRLAVLELSSTRLPAADRSSYQAPY